MRWGFLIWELIFIYSELFVLILVVFCDVSSFTTFRPNFTSGLLQVILPRPRIGMLSLVTVSPVITAFHSCCLSHHVFDQVNLWPAWVGFETAIIWQCSPGTVETQHLYPLRWLNCHYKFISAKNIIFVSSDDNHTSEETKILFFIEIKRNNNNSHASSTPIDLYEILHIFCTLHNPHLLS